MAGFSVMQPRQESKQRKTSHVTAVLRNQLVVFALTWLAYACANLIRKPVSVAKGAIAHEMSLNITQLGWLDTASLLPYAMFQLFAGSMGDRYGVSVVLGGGLAVAALSTFMASQSSDFSHMLLALALCGVGQSFVWPACSKAISLWFPEGQRAVVFGLWGTCQAVGGFVGTLLCSWLTEKVGWRASFLVPVVFTFVIALVNWGLLKTPNDLGMNAIKETDEGSELLDKEQHRDAIELRSLSSSLQHNSVFAPTVDGSDELESTSESATLPKLAMPHQPEGEDATHNEAIGTVRVRTSSRSHSRSRSPSSTPISTPARSRSSSTASSSSVGSRTPGTPSAVTLQVGEKESPCEFVLGPALAPVAESSLDMQVKADIETDIESDYPEKVQAPLLNADAKHKLQARCPSDDALPARMPAEHLSQQLSLLEAFTIPAFGPVAIAYLCLKLVRYVFMLWLPLYFTTLGCSLRLASFLAVTFEIGGAVGTALSGFVIQRGFKGRKILMTVTYCMLLTLCIIGFIVMSKTISDQTPVRADAEFVSHNVVEHNPMTDPSPYDSFLNSVRTQGEHSESALNLMQTSATEVEMNRTLNQSSAQTQEPQQAQPQLLPLPQLQQSQRSAPSVETDLKTRLFGQNANAATRVVENIIKPSESQPAAREATLASTKSEPAPKPNPTVRHADDDSPVAYGAYIMGLIMFMAGIFEPGFVLNGVVASELGEYQGRNVQAAVAGYINGLGGLGAVIQGPLVGAIADVFGWAGVFYLVTAICVVGALSLLPALALENQKLWTSASKALSA